MTTITYKAAAINLAQYAHHEPSESFMPTMKELGSLDNYTKDGWVVIGNVTVIVDYFDKEQLRSQQLGALKQKLESVRADNQKRENAILDAISNLSAIGYTEAA